jgi:ABC-type Fe3+/spermidine/putrescine transport system ATPase subunit
MIRVEHLCKQYGSIQAVRSVTMTVTPEEILAILGPSECGKTTLLRLIAGFERPDAGRVEIDGQVVSTPRRVTAPGRRHLSMIFQDLALWPHMSVYENIAFVLRGKRLPRQEVTTRVHEVLKQVSLDNHVQRYPHHLSGGKRQRLAIARALAPRPAYLLMDEPFSSLDPILKDEMMDLTLKLKEQFHMTVIYVTHNLDEGMALADRIAVMRQGALRRVASKHEASFCTQEDLLRWYTESF